MQNVTKLSYPVGRAFLGTLFFIGFLKPANRDRRRYFRDYTGSVEIYR